MQNNMNQPDHSPATPSIYLAPLFGAALVATMIIAIGGYALRNLPHERANSDCYEQEEQPGDQGPGDLASWPKPSVAIILSGQMHGYYDPCGCSVPQYGGLTRRFNFVGSLKAKGWDVAGIDLGELPSLKGIHEQNLLKYELSVRALATMNYRAMGIGADETLLPLGEGLTQIWDKNRDLPRPLHLSLAKAAPGQNYHDLNVRGYEIIANTKPRIGVISMMGPDLRDQLAKQEAFRNNLDELPKVLDEFARAGVEIGVILHHEYPELDKKRFPEGSTDYHKQMEKQRREQLLKAVQFCDTYRKTKNKKAPEIYLVMALTTEPEPPALTRKLDPKLKAEVVEIGHKGRYVGIVGVYPKGKKDYRLDYQLVKMGPEWDTKKGDEKNNKVIGLVEDYNKELKRQDMLAKYQRTPHYNQLQPQGVGGLKATYVGSERCGNCHAHAEAIWQNTEHFKATKRLEEGINPSGRQYDPECMMCHTTGFKHPGGYNDFVADLAKWPAKPAKAPAAQKIKNHNEALRGVGCESCHGPGSEHVKDPKNKALYDSINPYAPTAAERTLEAINPRNAQQEDQRKALFKKRTDQMALNLCMKCHDQENDVHWGQPGKTTFDKWKGGKHPLIHRTPPGNLPAKGNAPPPVLEIIQDKK